MQPQPKPTSRKKFLWWGAAFVAAVAATSKWLPFSKKSRAAGGGSATMLTQDGKLVQIDSRLIAGKGKKISTDDLKHWIHKQHPNPTGNGQQ